MALLQIDRNPSPKALRGFARLWLPAFVLMVSVLMYRGLGAQAAGIALGIGALLVVLANLYKEASQRIYLGLVYLSFPIGFVISHGVLALLYYGLITPIGLATIALGYDPMQRRSKQAASYWQARPRSQDPKRYFRQF